MAETVDLDEVVRPESPQSHFIAADRLLRRAGKLVEVIDEEGWADAREELAAVTKLAQAHAVLSGGRAR